MTPSEIVLIVTVGPLLLLLAVLMLGLTALIAAEIITDLKEFFR